MKPSVIKTYKHTIHGQEVEIKVYSEAVRFSDTPEERSIVEIITTAPKTKRKDLVEIIEELKEYGKEEEKEEDSTH